MAAPDGFSDWEARSKRLFAEAEAMPLGKPRDDLVLKANNLMKAAVMRQWILPSKPD